jgi:cell division transport system ATP-binding protein
MIQLTDISKSYADIAALKNINLFIDKGEMAFLTGASGAGKTTLLRLIYRAERPDKGGIAVAGWDLTKLKESAVPYLRRNVGVIFQEFRLLTNKTVFENIAIALRIRGLPNDTIKDKTHEILKNVGLRHKADLFPQWLSGGEQQRVVIARAMVVSPTILLADEPTGNLDSDNGKNILALFKEINTKGTTILIATHDKSLYSDTGKRVINLKDGSVEKETIG